MSRAPRPYSCFSNTAFIDALRDVLGLAPLPCSKHRRTRRGEHKLTEATLHSLDAPELVDEPTEEREHWTEPHGGWFREQRRLGIGITRGKPRPSYDRETR